MKLDHELLLLTILGGGLLAWGGSLLRSGTIIPVPVPSVPPPPPTPSDEPAVATELLRERLAQTESALLEIRQELEETNEAREAQRVEMVEQRQRSERQVQGAQAEIQRLAAELEGEKTQAQIRNDTVRELRSKVATLDDELKKVRANAPPPQALTLLQGEVTDAQKRIKAAGDERDAARAKVEALERLVEGVRARSRELAEELKILKGG
jgi:chromosome segregation ATPase